MSSTRTTTSFNREESSYNDTRFETPVVNAPADWQAQMWHEVDVDRVTGGSDPLDQEAFTRLMNNTSALATGASNAFSEGALTLNIAHQNQEFRWLHSMVDQAHEILHDAQGTTLKTRIDQRESAMESMSQLIMAQQGLLGKYKNQLDLMNAQGSGSGGRQPKVADPPTYHGTEGKTDLKEWFNQISLYCAISGIITDANRIAFALSRLRSPATKYVQSYFNKINNKQDIGSWDEFVKQLTNLYGKRDEKEGAKDEITKLWANKELAKKDFIKFAEQYRTLARMLSYQDDIHMDKIKEVLPQDLRSAMIPFDLSKNKTTDWEEYMDIILNVNKMMHPEKARTAIFGHGSISGGGPGHCPSAMMA